jgi:hypothetical protein
MSLTEPDSDSRDDQPTASLMGTHMGDRCSQCGAELAPDQRYCVDCGHRRGRARFSLDRGAGATGAVVGSRPGEPVLAPPAGVRPARTVNSTVALLASVAVLLIAVGVGVLIGHSNNSTPQKAQVIEVGGGSSASSGTSAGSTGAAATSSGSSSAVTVTPKSAAAAVKAAQAKAPKTKAAQKAAQKAPPSKAAQKAAAAAASSTATLSGSKKKAKIAAPTAKLGSTCTSGTAGCQGGKLTGNYFP